MSPNPYGPTEYVMSTGDPSPESRTESPDAEESQSWLDRAANNRAGGWMITAVFLTVIAFVSTTWGFYQAAELNKTKTQAANFTASTSAEIAALTGRMTAVETSTLQVTNDLAAVRQNLVTAGGTATTAMADAQLRYKNVQAALSVAAAQYADAMAKSKDLAARFESDKALAAAAVTDAKAQAAAATSMAALAKNCAMIFAGATEALFSSTQPIADMPAMADALALIAPECSMVTQ